MRGRVNAIRTFKGLVADLRYIYDGQLIEEQAAQNAANKIDSYAAEPAMGWNDWKK